MKIKATEIDCRGNIADITHTITDHPLHTLSLIIANKTPDTVRIVYDMALDPITPATPEGPEPVIEGLDPAYPPSYLPDPPSFGMRAGASSAVLRAGASSAVLSPEPVTEGSEPAPPA